MQHAVRNDARQDTDPGGAGTFVFPIRVYYEDTDAAGVVYYANYLKFVERGRTEWLRRLGFDQARLMAERGLGFVVSRLEADFRRAARLDDALEVHTRVERLGRASMLFAQRVQRAQEVLFEARVTVACVELARGKPTPIPNDIVSVLEGMQ